MWYVFIFSAVALLSIFFLFYRPRRGLYVVWVHIDDGNKRKVLPRGFQSHVRLDKNLRVPDGWTRWPDRFLDDPEWIGPVVLDDWSKTFMLINPGNTATLGLMSDTKIAYNLNEIKDYKVLFKF